MRNGKFYLYETTASDTTSDTSFSSFTYTFWRNPDPIFDVCVRESKNWLGRKKVCNHMLIEHMEQDMGHTFLRSQARIASE